jgi:hypothetical protein
MRTLTREELDRVLREQAALIRARQARQRERDRQRAVREKHLLHALEGRGFFTMLRQAAEGGQNLEHRAQLKIIKAVRDAVERELCSIELHKRNGTHKYRDPRRSKIETLLGDPSITNGERVAAEAALGRLRTRRPTQTQ